MTFPFKPIVLSVLTIFLPATGIAADSVSRPAAGPVTFRDGNTIVFLGDSITHTWDQQVTYCEFIENFYYTRYPRIRLHFMNAGVSGSQTRHALKRFDQAVARHKPDYVVMMLGMNDAGYTDFDAVRFRTYETGMRNLLDRIAMLKAIAIPMIPTLLDYRYVELVPGASEEQKRDILGNVSTLGYYGTWLREEALTRGIPVVDQAAGFTRFLWSIRRTDPNYMLAPDAIHPTPAGLWVMAHTFIEAMESERFTSSVDIFLRQGTVEGVAAGGELSDMGRTNGSIRFTFHARSLPWVPPPEKDAVSKTGITFAYRHLQSGSVLSRERLRVIALASNKYDLMIDGQRVGTFSHTHLATGIDLQDNSLTPQYRQALSVAALNAEKTHGPMYQLGLEYKKVEASGGLVDTVILAPLEARILEFEKRIYAANQPRPHRYEIIAAEP